MTAPFTLKVLGTISDPALGDIIVVEYRPSAAGSPSLFRCRGGSTLVFDQKAWTSLKAAETALVRATADQERRREAVRDILRRNAGQRPAK